MSNNPQSQDRKIALLHMILHTRPDLTVEQAVEEATKAYNKFKE